MTRAKTPRTRCAGIKRYTGEPCTYTRLPGSAFCSNHDPEKAEQRRQDGAKRTTSRSPVAQQAHEAYRGSTRTIADIAQRLISIADRARLGHYDDQDSERGGKLEANALKLAKEAFESERDRADRIAVEEAKRTTREQNGLPGDLSSNTGQNVPPGPAGLWEPVN